MRLANSDQIRLADQIMIEEKAYPGLLLMETAGRKSAEWILQRYPNQAECVVLVGPGNNGGDGLVIARYLSQAGKQVNILLSHSPKRFQGDALTNYNALRGLKVGFLISFDPQSADEGTLLIDALLGTGISDAPRGSIREIIAGLRDIGFPCVAIDLPSGLSADTGQVFEDFKPIPAEFTLTFQCPKICHFVTPASNFCGQVVTIDIGIFPEVMEQVGIRRSLVHGATARESLRSREPDTHKGIQGHAMLVGGTRLYAGAIALSAHAALHMGAGLSTAMTAEAARVAVYEVGPEVMVKALPGDELAGAHAEEAVEFILNLGADAAGIGPGLGKGAASLFPLLLDSLRETPLVLDADALNILAENPDLWEKIHPNTILTPHPGEFRRLAGPDLESLGRLHAAERFAREKNVILVLKGAHTIVAAPNGETRVNTSGNPGMATAGSGDVLTGVITALLARGYETFEAASLGVYLHGLAGDLCAEEFGEAGVTAGRIMRKLGNAEQLVQTGTAPNPLSI